MPTLPPRSLSYPDPSDGNYRALCLPNDTCTYLHPDHKWGSQTDPLSYEGWDAASWTGPEAEIIDLSDDEIREICRLEPEERDALIAAISTRREVTRILAGNPVPVILPADQPGWIVCEGAKIRVDSVRGVLRVACNAIEIVWEGRSKWIECADEAEADREEARICALIPGLAKICRKG